MTTEDSGPSRRLDIDAIGYNKPMSRKAPTKKTARQLDGEIDAALEVHDDRRMEAITRERVLEPLVNEQITRTEDITITLIDAIGPEPWKLVFTKGRNIGGANSGRILVTLGGVDDPLAGLAWATERGEPYVHHIWVESDARRRGLTQRLFRAYQAHVSPELVVKGPFTKGGRAAALRAGARLDD